MIGWRIEPSGNDTLVTVLNTSTNARQRLELSGSEIIINPANNIVVNYDAQIQQATTVTGNFTVGSVLYVNTSTNNVGIGSATPNSLYALDVSGDITCSGLTSASSLSGELSTSNQTGITSLGTLSSLTVTGQFDVGGSFLFVKPSTNNVGIGTSSPNPSYALNVTGDINFTTDLYNNGSTFIGNKSYPWTENGSKLYVTGQSVGIQTSSASRTLHASSMTVSQDLIHKSITFLPAYLNDRQASGYLNILNAGIGTAIPDYPVYVFSSDDSKFSKCCLEWAAKAVGSGTDSAGGIAVDSSGNSYLAGNFSTSGVTLFNWNDTAFSPAITGPTTPGSYVAKYNSFGEVQWRALMDGSGTDEIRYSATDSSGNVLIAMTHSNTLSVYNSNNTLFGGGAVPFDGNQSATTIKYNTSGNVVWLVRVDSATGEFNFFVHADSSDNVYMSGRSSGTITILQNNGTASGSSVPGLVNNGNSGGNDGFLVKFTSGGLFSWYTKISGSGNDWILGIGTDSSLNVYVSGLYTSTTLNFFDANTTTNRATLSNNSGASSGFIAKYNSSGVFQWRARVLAAASTSIGITIKNCADSSGNSYFIGNNTGSCTIQNSDLTNFGTVSNAGGLLVKYDTSGFVVWRVLVTGSGSLQDVVVDSNTGNVFVVGDITGTTTLTNSNNTTFTTLSTNGGFLAKISSSGNWLWTTRCINPSVGGASSVRLKIDNNKKIYVGGDFPASTIDLYNQNGAVAKSLSSGGGDAAFIAKYQDFAAFDLVTVSSVSIYNGSIVKLVNKLPDSSLPTAVNLKGSTVNTKITNTIFFNDSITFVNYTGVWYPL
jgi:hypothetical protein